MNQAISIQHIPVKPFQTIGGVNYYLLSDGSVKKKPVGWRGNQFSEVDTYYEIHFGGEFYNGR